MKSNKKDLFADVIRVVDNYNGEGVHGCTTCKKAITVQIRVVDDIVVDAGGKAEGCYYSRQCLAALITMIKGKSVYELYPMTNEDLRPNLQTVKDDYDCDVFTIGALKLALRDWEKKMAA
ncbi:MAG: iron-sulfur cluster assembly scaffold protein [Thermodesulfobacteriota bacterium]